MFAWTDALNEDDLWYGGRMDRASDEGLYGIYQQLKSESVKDRPYALQGFPTGSRLPPPGNAREGPGILCYLKAREAMNHRNLGFP